MTTPYVVVDFETLSACDLTTAGSDRYASDPSTEVLCLASEDSQGRRCLWYPGDPCPEPLARAIANPDVLFVAHKADFERAFWKWQMVAEYGWPDLPLERWHDTMARCQQMVVPAALDRALKVLGGPMAKDMEGNALVKRLNREYHKDGTRPQIPPAMLERIGAYCLTDIDGQVWLHKRLGWLPPHEREIWLQSQRTNDRGVRLDAGLIDAMSAIVDEATGPLAERFKVLTGGLKFTQTGKTKAWVEGHGVKVKNLAKDTLAALLAGEEDTDAEEDATGESCAEDDVWGVEEAEEHELPADVREALTIRQLVGSASVKKLPAMRRCRSFDGRARNLLVYHGTGPGRQAGRLLQPHNFPRGSLKEDGETPDPAPLIKVLRLRDVGLIEMMYGPAVETVVSSLRHTLIPEDDCVFVAGDYAQIQARTVLALAGQDDKVALLARGEDPYCDIGGRIHGRIITKADLIERQDGKNSVLGLGFQMGDKTFHRKYARKRPLAFATGVVHVYRKDWAPMVPKLWYDLQDAAIKAVWDGVPVTAECGITYYMEDHWLNARFFNGSTIHYYNPQRTRRTVPWDETDVRRGFSYQVMKAGQWVTRDAFGGQLTENAVMKIEREIMEGAKKRLEAAGFPVVLEVHDELLAEVNRRGADLNAFRQIQEDVEPWVRALNIPIKVDAWMGDCYRK